MDYNKNQTIEINKKNNKKEKKKKKKKKLDRAQGKYSHIKW